jgi:hypothetical protein
MTAFTGVSWIMLGEATLSICTLLGEVLKGEDDKHGAIS